ncbi:MAG: hypothetical protein MUO40_02645 [Anaerolineaceae bacterium]|nr:hypothetical protein [Anaerolineaceae bacterium]
MQIQLLQINKKSSIIFLMITLISSYLLTAHKSFQPPDPIHPKTIFILSPSTGSSLVSPIQLQAEVTCNPNNFVRIELIDTNRNLLYRQVIRHECGIASIFKLNESIYFDTNKKDSLARLTISLLDNSSRILAISSVNLALSNEKQSLLPSPLNQTDFLIISPKEDSLTQGGSLMVYGWVNPPNMSPVILELISESGKLIGSRQILIHNNLLEDFQYFEINIPYDIPGIQLVRFTIRQMGEKIPGNVSLESQIIQLGP